mgnify:CR=1 FL=1
MTEMTLDTMDKRILDIIQTDFPLESRPYAIIAERLGITEQEAKSIATGNAGVTEDGIQYITVKQDWDDGKARYEVEFTAAGEEYDYELDASDGRILSADSEVIDKGYSASQNGTADSQNAAGTSQTTQGGVSIETADRKSTRLNSSHPSRSRMPSSA